jgi:8-oxo-dGTP pyrophosphatase MutT (NUDIX family)
MADIDRIGVLILRGDRILLCRKNRESARLILPGGRIEPGESDLDCLAREIREAFGAASLEQVWFGPDSDRSALTPILVNRILPDLLTRNVLPWGAT